MSQTLKTSRLEGIHEGGRGRNGRDKFYQEEIEDGRNRRGAGGISERKKR